MTSRIYKSINPAVANTEVHSADLEQRILSSPKPDRPKGGFYNPTAGTAPSAPPLSRQQQREAEAGRLLEEAKTRAEVIQRDAYHAGFEQGERAGEKLAAQKLDPALQMLSDMIQAVSEQRDALIKQHESELIRIAFLIAEKVVHSAIQLEPRVVTEVVGAALEKVSKSQPVTILVSPKDLTLVQQHLSRARAGFLASEHVKLKADETVARGGCRLVTDTGDIDATIESQLKAFQSMLW
jgi:flagellar assembly protein FliH